MSSEKSSDVFQLSGRVQKLLKFQVRVIQVALHRIVEDKSLFGKQRFLDLSCLENKLIFMGPSTQGTKLIFSNVGIA